MDPQYLHCGAPKIAKLVQITPISLWFMGLITSYNYSFHGVYKPTNSHHWAPQYLWHLAFHHPTVPKHDQKPSLHPGDDAGMKHLLGGSSHLVSG